MWLFLELALVVCLLWGLLDSFLVDEYTLPSALGHGYRTGVSDQPGKGCGELSGFPSGLLREQTEGEDLLRLLELVERVPEVEATCVSVCGCPFLSRNWWSSLMRAEADSTDAGERCDTYAGGVERIFRCVSHDGQAGSSLAGGDGGERRAVGDIRGWRRYSSTRIGRGAELEMGMDDLRIMPWPPSLPRCATTRIRRARLALSSCAGRGRR